MKKKTFTILIMLTMSMGFIGGCSSKSEQGEKDNVKNQKEQSVLANGDENAISEESENVEIENPHTETDKQGIMDATDNPEVDPKNEIHGYFLGEHIKSYDESTLNISDNKDGTFRIDISITRLCSLENGVGTFDDHKMTFSVEDPNGENMVGMIYRDSDNSLVVEITDSVWNYLPNGEIIDGFGK